jgi:hypothetical protein
VGDTAGRFTAKFGSGTHGRIECARLEVYARNEGGDERVEWDLLGLEMAYDWVILRRASKLTFQ